MKKLLETLISPQTSYFDAFRGYLLSEDCKREPQNTPSLFENAPTSDQDYGITDLIRYLDNDLRNIVQNLIAAIPV